MSEGFSFNKETIIVWITCTLLCLGFTGIIAYQAIQNNNLRETINEINNSLNRETAINELPNNSLGGSYKHQQKFYWVSTNATPDTVYYRGLHEYGHYVYWQLLDNTQREQWKNISNQSNYYITEYAKTSPSEDFSEMFSLGTYCTYEGAYQHNNEKDDYFYRVVDPLLREEGVLW